ncbi:MAG: GIY-YIG nuclease family protein [Thermoguttaceae bacterium]|nr:GIY-YIG nuclease family protein [Thermoguttaceae bacterium]
MGEQKLVLYIASRRNRRDTVKIGFTSNIKRVQDNWQKEGSTKRPYKLIATYEVTKRVSEENIARLFRVKLLRLKKSKDLYKLPEKRIPEIQKILEIMAILHDNKAGLNKYRLPPKAPVEVSKSDESEREDNITFERVQIKDGESVVFRKKGNARDGETFCVVQPNLLLDPDDGINKPMTTLAKKLLHKKIGVRGSDFFRYLDPNLKIEETIVRRFERLKREGKIK